MAEYGRVVDINFKFPRCQRVPECDGHSMTGGADVEEIELVEVPDAEGQVCPPRLSAKVVRGVVNGSSRPLLDGVSSDYDSDKSDKEIGVTSRLPRPDSGEVSTSNTAAQVFFPYMMAGFGTVGAGLLLDYSQVSICM